MVLTNDDSDKIRQFKRWIMFTRLHPSMGGLVTIEDKLNNMKVCDERDDMMSWTVFANGLRL